MGNGNTNVTNCGLRPHKGHTTKLGSFPALSRWVSVMFAVAGCLSLSAVAGYLLLSAAAVDMKTVSQFALPTWYHPPPTRDVQYFFRFD